MAKPLILVVDDEKVFADFLVDKIKETERYETAVTYSAKEAFEHLKRHRKFMGMGGNDIKLILLDIKMPEMDGLQFLEKLRKDFNEGEIGVMMVTAYEDEEKWNRATSGFVVGYLKKPINDKELIEKIDLFFSDPEKRFEMTVKTFEKHIDKREEWEKEKPNEV
jgi:CheY-like chemotaxis protein